MGSRRQVPIRVFSENRESEVRQGVKRLQNDQNIPDSKRNLLALRASPNENKVMVTRTASKQSNYYSDIDATKERAREIIKASKSLAEKAPKKRKETNVMVPHSDATPRDFYVSKKDLPRNVIDTDERFLSDATCEPHYAHESFLYLRRRELKFICRHYLDSQSDLTPDHRALLVDWMVDVQESFELNHETLYMAVKMVDCYLSKQLIEKTKIQLLGATAMMISSKIDERVPPNLDEFVFICDNAYTADDFLSMEREVLSRLDFDVSMPLSYSFLRRYCRTIDMTMEQMTLARFILECSLMNYHLISERESKIAAASLYLALEVLGQSWNDTLSYYTGYRPNDLEILSDKLNRQVMELRRRSEGQSRARTKTIINKYSHSVFYKVALFSFPPPVDMK